MAFAASEPVLTVMIRGSGIDRLHHAIHAPLAPVFLLSLLLFRDIFLLHDDGGSSHNRVAIVGQFSPDEHPVAGLHLLQLDGRRTLQILMSRGSANHGRRLAERAH